MEEERGSGGALQRPHWGRRPHLRHQGGRRVHARVVCSAGRLELTTEDGFGEAAGGAAMGKEQHTTVLESPLPLAYWV
ncbi:hypothetical protein E2562_022929 [Oryza meyeriana var. granulata]|uniref:Uncharacterized protein n=1 Tax=Oryza meyeriana var. granulata TaxID=110450 RepID=A0A6G1D5Q1_9ORYZ|nr:hypothetical protein E2562_022929 [Oryza meyeriana var. granulata]